MESEKHCLTNCHTSHVGLPTLHVYSHNVKMTSKRGKNNEVRYKPQASSVTDVLTRFDVLCALSEYRRTAEVDPFVL